MGAISIVSFMLFSPSVQDKNTHCLFSPRESKACKILETVVSRKQECSGLACVHLPGLLDDLGVYRVIWQVWREGRKLCEAVGGV